jgi:hypothetical protein
MGEPVPKPILGVGRFAGLNREYSVEYSIGSGAATSGSAYRLGLKKGIFSGIFFGAAGGSACGSAWRGVTGSNMARVDCTRRLPLERVAARGPTVQDLQVARVAHRGLRSS